MIAIDNHISIIRTILNSDFKCPGWTQLKPWKKLSILLPPSVQSIHDQLCEIKIHLNNIFEFSVHS